MHEQTHVASTTWTVDDLEAAPGPTRDELEKRFLASCTPELRQKAIRFASRRLDALGVAGYSTGTRDAEDLVNDALADVWMRLEAWRPDDVPLISEVTGRLGHLLWRERRAAARQRRWFGERSPDDILDEVSVEPSFEIEAARARIDALLASLCVHVDPASDEAEILRCWEQGIVDRDEVLATAELDSDRYKAALRRLRRWARDVHAVEP